MSEAAPILVGTDLSAHSNLAVVEAARRAQREHRQLLVAYVASEQSFAMVDASKVAAALGDHIGKLTTHGAECQLMAGSPHAELIKLADKRGAGLLVIGASGEGSVGDALFGTTAENVVRYAHGPVLVVREGPAKPLSVIVGTDFSEASEAPLKVGIEEAKKASAPLMLFHSMHEPGSRWDVLGQLGFSASESETDRAARRRAAEAKLESLLQGAGVDGRSVIVNEPPGEALASLAESENAALIVVGTHGRTGLKRMALGSVAATVVRGAPCSVLVVR
jgi:nucleotide-binding universal stress UspA family protein